MKRTPLTRKTALKGGGNLKRTKLKPQSDNQAAQMVTYGRLIKLVRPTWTHCARCECPGSPESFEPHHPYLRGRGRAEWKTYLVMPLCHSCHTFVHEHPRLGREAGYLPKARTL